MKKWVAWVMAASMAAGSMGVTAYGSVFTDIGSVPWPGAATFIDQAASMGLMNGYNENGKKYCKPRNNVSYCEAVQLMYSIMKAHSKQDVSDTVVTKWKPVMSAYNIPSWAYNAVAYGLENNILATEELGKMRNGTGNANREDVGRIFGKALSTLDGYKLDSNPSLSYRDAMQVSSDAKPYLELLNRSKLMVGDTNNNFNPKSNINRSEMAVLSVKTYNTLTQNNGSSVTQAPGTVVGTVVNSMVLSNGDLFLSLRTNTGAGMNLFGAKNTLKPTYDNKTIEFTDIGTGDTVTAAYSGDQLKSLIVTNSKAGIKKDVTYELSKITSTRVTIKDGSKEKYYDIDRNADIRLEGSRSTTSKISDALKDAKYNVTLTLDKDEYVTKLDAVKSSDNPTKGLLTRLTDSKITIKSGSKNYEYTLDDDVTIKKNGSSVAFSKLQRDYDDNNYTVSLKLNSKGHVTGITIESEEDETHGQLYFLNSRRIEIKANGDIHKYNIYDDDVDVYIDGKNKSLDTLKSSFNDDEKGYTIELEVDKYDYATVIRATSKNAENSEGTLKKITSSEIQITNNKKDYTHELASDVKVTIDDKKSSVDNLKEYYDEYTYNVKLEFNTKNKVSEIEAEIDEVTKGILKDIDDRDSEIKVEAGGVNYDLEYTSSVKVTLDGDNISLDELDDELDGRDDIYVELTYSGSKVSKIKASLDDKSGDTVKGTIYSMDVDDDKIRVQNNSGKTYYMLSNSDIDVRLDGSSSTFVKLEHAFDNLKSYEVIEVTLTLNSRGNVTKIVADIVDEDDTNDSKPKAGYLRNISTSGNGRITIAETKSSSKEYTWNLEEDTKILFVINDSMTYDRNYKTTLSGLDIFWDDCTDNNDECYIELRTSSSNGDVTRITASDMR